MRDFLDDFYYGRVVPNECAMPHTPELMSAERELAEAETFLRDRLEGECATALARLLKAHEDMASASGKEQFINGLKMGARLTLALLGYAPGEV